MVLAPRAGLPPAFLLALGIRLVVIFGFLLSPAEDSAREVAHHAVTVLLAPTSEAPEISQAKAAANQRGSLSQTLPEASLVESSSPKPIETDSAAMTQSGLAMSAAISTTSPQPPVAARTALGADYLLQWQGDIERFGNAYYLGLALRHGDGSLQQIDFLQSSGSASLGQAAVDTVEKLAPFAPFPEVLARETQRLAVVRTWQLRR